MGPDDWHPKVNNNAYTNVVASLAIHWARYMACMCGRSERTEVGTAGRARQGAAFHCLNRDSFDRFHSCASDAKIRDAWQLSSLFSLFSGSNIH